MQDHDLRYTVVVLYPQRLWYLGKPQTYTAMVKAGSPHQALKVAAREAHSKQSTSERGKLLEWTPLVAFKGHIDVQAWGT